MHIFVFDDDIQERNLIICHIKSYFYGRKPSVTIRAFGSEVLPDETVGTNVPDIALICHDGDHGIQIAWQIRKLYKSCALVLISNSPQYGLEAYDLRAAHYLVKPVGYSQLCQALERCDRHK